MGLPRGFKEWSIFFGVVLGLPRGFKEQSGLSSFGVGNVTVSVIRIPGLNIIIIESVFGLIWPYSSKTSPKLGYVRQPLNIMRQ